MIDHQKYDLELIDPLFAIPKRLTSDLRRRLERDLCDNEEMVPEKTEVEVESVEIQGKEGVLSEEKEGMKKEEPKKE